MQPTLLSSRCGSGELSAIREIVSFDTDAVDPAKWAEISPVVRPLAHKERTISSNPVQPALSFLHICGSNEPSRSRGPSICT